MARVLNVLFLVAFFAFLVACGSKSGPTQTGMTGITFDGNTKTETQEGQEGNEVPDDGSDLEIVFVSATPSDGTSPLEVDFIAVVRGGVPPYTYFWDYTNDGAFDKIDAQKPSSTASANYTYQYLEKDRLLGESQSIYSVGFRVVDSRADEGGDPNYAVRDIELEGKVVVRSDSQFKINPSSTGILSSHIGDPVPLQFSNRGIDMTIDFYTFRSGDDIRFQAKGADGKPPYSYRWNFDHAIVVPDVLGQYFATELDYKVDSTSSLPHYSFSYNNRPEMSEEANFRLIQVQAVDSRGNLVQKFIGIKVVPIDFTPPPPPEKFRVFVVTDPAVFLDTDPAPFSAEDIPIVVQVDDDNVDINGIPIIPNVNFSATVSTKVDEAGIPPYFYTWDFEGDGYIDSQAFAPTVPFWDSDRNELVNPYRWPGDYVAILRITDAVGTIVTTNIPVHSENVTGKKEVNPLVVDPFVYTEDEGGLIEETEFISSVTAENALNVIYNMNLSGGVLSYLVEWDADFNGNFGNPQDIQVTIEDGMALIDRLELTKFNAGALELGYYLGNMRVTDSSPQPEIVRKYQPMSITYRVPNAQNVRPDNELENRAYHGMAMIGGDAYLVGGFIGNVALKSVERVHWSDGSYAIESSKQPGGALTDMPTPRGGLAADSIENHLITVGGFTNIDGATAKVETMLDVGDGLWGWVSRPKIGARSGISKELTQLNMTPSALYINFDGGPPELSPGFIVSGGRIDGGSVSGTTWFYLPHEGWPDYTPGTFNPLNDYWFTLDAMPTPRYDFAIATLGEWIYTIGGITSDGTISTTVEALHVTGNGNNIAVWVTLPPLPEPRAGAFAAGHEGENIISIYGGYSGVNDSGDYILASEAYVYSPAYNGWSQTQPLQRKRTHFDGVISGNTIIAAGGEDEFQAELDNFFEIRVAS